MFSKIIGLNNICCDLEKRINQANLATAYIFSGGLHRGKSFLASQLAKALLCKNNTGCNYCNSCILFDKKLHPDFLIYKPKTNFIQIDQIKELNKKIFLAPSISTKRLILIKEAEKMSQEAANCFLKSLEEPPLNNYFILTTTNENAILDTIKSRCQTLFFPEPTTEEIKTLIENQTKLSKEEFQWLLPFQKAGIKKNWLAKHKELDQVRQKIWQLFSHLDNTTAVELHNYGQQFLHKKDLFNTAFEFAAAFFYDLNILALNSSHNLLYCPDLHNITQLALNKYKVANTLEIFNHIAACEFQVQNFANKQLAWTSIIIKAKKSLL